MKYNFSINLFKTSFLVLLIYLSAFNCRKNSTELDDLSVLSFDSVRAALYLSDAVWPNCKINTGNIIKKTGQTYAIINKDSILAGSLTNYSVLIMPGGRPDLFESEIGQSGAKKIREYVSRGGGYIGICGGAFIASKNNVWRGWAGEPRVYYSYQGLFPLFKGTADGPVEDFAPDYQDFNCGIVTVNKHHFILSGLDDTFTYLYDHGPMFPTSGDSNEVPLGISINGEKTLILATQFNNGRVFLTGGHPEVSNDRDCTTLFKNAVIWCSRLE